MAPKSEKLLGLVTAEWPMASRNRQKTHCPRGHAYDAANTRLYGGRRYCRACARLRAGEQRHAAYERMKADPDQYAAHLARNREWVRANRERVNAYQREWRAAKKAQRQQTTEGQGSRNFGGIRPCDPED